MIRWSNSGKIFEERWLCEYVSDELITRDTNGDGSIAYYVRVRPGGFVNPTDYTHLVEVDHSYTDYWHLAATLLQEEHEGNEIFRVPTWINNHDADRREHFCSVGLMPCKE